MKPTSRRLMLSRTTLRELTTEDIAEVRGATTLVGCSIVNGPPRNPESLARTFTQGTLYFGMCQFTLNATCFC